MSYVWRYEGNCELPSDIAEAIKNEWETTLKNERARILNALQTKIPDQAAFLDKLADASSDRFEEFLASVGGDWNKDIIVTKQRVKLAAKYDAWNTGITNAFAEGGVFETNVTNKKEKFKELRRVIGAVGHKALGTWNPVVMGVLLLRGDSRVLKYLDANDSFSGTLQAAFDSIKGRYITPSMIAQAVQAVVIAKYADEGNLTTIRDNVLSNANTILADMVNFAKKSGYTVVYELSWNDTVENVKVKAELTSTA
ncbi:MAG: hypothetical protein DRO23_12035 [Thermoprotei archaeon]|nr:MAG: hypothetical protein DRO23_12035 [Thermoprotei archaeon]